MTPEQLLTLHATHPAKTPSHLSRLSSTALAELLRSINTHPGLITPLWTHPPLHTAILSLKPPPTALLNHLQTLSHAPESLKCRIKQITTSATTAYRVKNYALIPPMLQALSKLPGPTAAEMRSTIFKVFLAVAPPQVGLIAQIAEIGCLESEYKDVILFIVRSLKQIPPIQHARLLQPMLLSPIPLVNPITYILCHATRETLTALEACLLDNISYAPAIVIMITRSIFSKAIYVTTELLQTMFILLTKADEPTKGDLTNTIERILNSNTALLHTPPSEGSSASDITTVFTNAIRKIPTGCEQEVSDFLETILSKSRKIGAILLEELFIWHPNSRTKVLKSVIAALSTPARKAVHTAFMDLFKRLVVQPTTAVCMRSCIDTLKEALDFVFLMPVGFDAIFVKYLSRVMATIPGGRDRILMFLRKLSGTRAIREQRVACRGLVSVVCVDAGEDLHDDACDMLVLLSESAAGEYLIGLLLEAVQHSHLNVERIGTVLKAITERFGVMFDNGSVDICRCFELIDGDYVLRDPFPVMLRLCIVAQGGTPDPFLGRLMKYLCDKQGAIKHACSGTSPVPAAEQLRLLCNLLETAMGLGVVGKDEDVVSIYGAAIVLRDLFVGRCRDDDRSRRVSRRGKTDDECLTMQQAAVASQVGGSLNESKDAELLSSLGLRIQSVSAVEKINVCKVPALVNVVRSEILAHVETDIRSILAMKKVSISSTHVDNLLSLIRKFFATSSPWAARDQPAEESDIRKADLKGGGSNNELGNTPKEGPLSFLSALGLDDDALKSFEESILERLQEVKRIHMRQSSFRILCTLLSQRLIQNDVAFIISLMEGETVTEDGNKRTHEGPNQRKQTRRGQSSRAEIQKDERLVAVSRITAMFRRELANVLSINLTLSYLELLGHLVSKECKRYEDTKKARNFVSETLLFLLKEYPIHHMSVMRSTLTLLTNTFEPITGLDFAKSVLTWLGNSPCLLNSKFVESDDGNGKLGVDEFEADIVAEAIALDAGVESEEEKVSDESEEGEGLFLRDDSLGVLCSDLVDEESPLGERECHVLRNSTIQGERDNTCYESTSRMISDDTDPVKSLCLDETPDVALLSVNSMLELCGVFLGREALKYRNALKSPSMNVSAADLVTERICVVMQTFVETEFMQSFDSKIQVIPALLLKRLLRIVHRLLEVVQLVLQLVLKLLRNKTRPSSTEPYLRTASSILNTLYEGSLSDAMLSAALQDARRANRSSLQADIDISAARLFQYVSSGNCGLDAATRQSVTRLKDVLKSHKKRQPHIHSVKTSWAKSSESGEVPEDYFRVFRSRKKQRVRSRNPDIDEWIRDEHEGDNFADLEDFVVPLDTDEL